jgi:hypothetical protein
MKHSAALIALPLVVFLAIGAFAVSAATQPDDTPAGLTGICELMPWWPGCP